MRRAHYDDETIQAQIEAVAVYIRSNGPVTLRQIGAAIGLTQTGTIRKRVTPLADVSEIVCVGRGMRAVWMWHDHPDRELLESDRAARARRERHNVSSRLDAPQQRTVPAAACRITVPQGVPSSVWDLAK